jgi:hypothetical protein
MAEERTGIVDLGRLAWPAWDLPTKRFRLFVAANTTRVPACQISAFAQAALAKGMVYLCVWGDGCQRFHDIVDQVILEDDAGERKFGGPGPHDVIMTTWHDHDSLEEALAFFARCAIPIAGLLDDSEYWLAVCVGNSKWASVAARFLRATPICRVTVEGCKTMVEVSRRKAAYEPSKRIVRSAKDLVAFMQPLRNRASAALVFDSSCQPALSGVRGSGLAVRQLMFESGDIVVDIVADTKSRRGLIYLVGQVMRKQDPYLNVPIALSKGAEQCATFTNRFGEFQFETENAATLNLTVVLPGSRLIEIPLDMLGHSQDP